MYTNTRQSALCAYSYLVYRVVAHLLALFLEVSKSKKCAYMYSCMLKKTFTTVSWAHVNFMTGMTL